MEQEKENLRNEPGSMQRQTQNIDNKEQAEDIEAGQFSVVSVREAKGSDVDKDREEAVRFENDANLEEADDEVTSLTKAKRNPWNSITFDSDDFFGGLTPA